MKQLFSFLLLTALLTPSLAIAENYAVGLGTDCEPIGLIAKGKEG